MSDPKAFEMMFPQYRSAVRVPSSLRLYHFDMRKSAPGKNAASTKPRKKRVRSAPMKLVGVKSGDISRDEICASCRSDSLVGYSCKWGHEAPSLHTAKGTDL